MTNILEFKAVMVRNGFTIKSLAKAMGLSYHGLALKINNKHDFTQTEIVFLTDLLHLTKQEQGKIFLNE